MTASPGGAAAGRETQTDTTIVAAAFIASLCLSALVLGFSPLNLAMPAAAIVAACIAGVTAATRPYASGPWLLGFATSAGAAIPVVVWVGQRIGSDVATPALILIVLIWSALFLGVTWWLSAGAAWLARRVRRSAS